MSHQNIKELLDPTKVIRYWSFSLALIPSIISLVVLLNSIFPRCRNPILDLGYFKGRNSDKENIALGLKFIFSLTNLVTFYSLKSDFFNKFSILSCLSIMSAIHIILNIGDVIAFIQSAGREESLKIRCTKIIRSLNLLEWCVIMYFVECSLMSTLYVANFIYSTYYFILNFFVGNCNLTHVVGWFNLTYNTGLILASTLFLNMVFFVLLWLISIFVIGSFILILELIHKRKSEDLSKKVSYI